jgi:radical SAM superfamily enzyme YgiQ (UPF0313 family)
MSKIVFLTFYLEYSIGVYLLSSILQEAGYDVSVLFFKLPSKGKIPWFKNNPINVEHIDMNGNIIGHNADINKWTEKEMDILVNKISDISPDVLCVSTRSTDEALVKEVLPQIRSKIDVLTIAGGYGPTLDYELYVDLVDYVYIGEAENAILEIMEHVDKKKTLDTLDNIYYKKNNLIYKNKLRKPNVEKFKQQIIPDEVYYIDNNTLYGAEKRKEIIQTHSYSTFFGKGCISSCSYCSAGQWGKIYKNEGFKVKKRRNRPVEDIIEELKLLKKADCTFVHFRDEFLYASRDTLKHFFKLYEQEVCLPFWAYLVPDQVLTHPELLKLAVDAGFVDTEIGFQTGSDTINKKIYNRHISNSRSVKYAELLTEYSINIKYDFILFNPVETFNDIKATIRLIQALPKKRSYLQLSRLHYFPCSPIVDTLQKYKMSAEDIEYHYCVALLYLLSFVLPKNIFNKILNDKIKRNSKIFLLETYRSYIAENKIEFSIGTHDVPNSITTNRYKRILEKNKYEKVIVWGAGNYYKDLSGIFNDTVITNLIDHRYVNKKINGMTVSTPEVLDEDKGNLPIFICSRHKQEIKVNILKDYPSYTNRIFV